MAVAGVTLDREEGLARLNVRLSIDSPVMPAGSAPRASRAHRLQPSPQPSTCGLRSYRRSPPTPQLDRLVVAELQHTVADDLAGLVAFAGNQQHIAPLQRSIDAADCLAAVADFDGAGAPPSRIAARIASGFSLRGLSSVTMTRSAVWAAIALFINGRLPASRLPPPPNTTISLPFHIGPQRLAASFSKRIGLVRVIDKNRRAISLAGEVETARRAFSAGTER